MALVRFLQRGYALLRELRRITRNFRSARDDVAAELRFNARLIERSWGDAVPPSRTMARLTDPPYWKEVRTEIQVTGWRQHSHILAAMSESKRDGSLLRELRQTYEMLDISRVESRPRVHSEDVFFLASRLEDVEI
jgi:hypothetical protein